MSIIEFCEFHIACDDGREWALANCRDMDHAWDTLKPDWLIWVATRPDVLDDRTLRIFACWCARQVQHLMQDERSIAALDVAERHANGQATDQELSAAEAAAGAAAGAAAWPAAGAAAEAAAWAASWAAAGAAAEAAAGAAAGAAAWDRQTEWLRANAKPNWEHKP